MGQYTGVITLTEYIPPQLDGKNIEGIKNLYALSSNGEIPPEEGEIEILVNQEELSVKKEGNKIFDVTNNKVNILESGFFYIQNTSKLVIVDNIWMNSTPKDVKGRYLWTKTQFDYTNDEADITYTVSYIGADGQAGLDANPYVIDTNCEEILIFESKNSTSAEYEHEYSPGSLNFTVYNNKGEEQEEIILTKYNYKLEHLFEGKFVEVPWEYITFGIQSTQSLGSEETLNLDIEKYAKKYPVGPSLVFRFSYMDRDRVLQRKVIPVRFGVSQEMAKLNINAAGITASIEEGNLEFSKDGLTYTNEGKKVFAVGNGGDVLVRGTIYATSGEFTGKVTATSGEFNGAIKAQSGEIGGFKIGSKTLKSSAIYLNEKNEEIPCIELNGEEGSIYAKNITLGDGATIENYIKLGEAKLLNPEKNEGVILQSGKITLNDTGKLKIGNIILSGDPANNYITAGASSNNSETGITANWIIRGDGTSEFREIIADKITIKDSIMEIGTVQGMSGVMLFKDSWRISTIEPVEGSTNIKCTLELSSSKQSDGEILAKPLLAKDDYLLANHNTYYKVVEIEDIEPYKVTLSTNGNINLQKGEVLVKVGKKGDYLITVQGDSADHRQDSGHKYSTPYSLTMSTIIAENGDSIPSYDKQLVLGDLTTLTDKMEGIAGTGLYAENVFLNGSLVTRTSNNTNVDGEAKYAGINTTTGATATVFEENDKSKIVIWAGASGNNFEAIQGAKFQVTEEGSLYATQGKFNGSLITDSVIKGASLHATKIFGENKEGAGVALQIYDARNGIQFIKNRQSPQLIDLESLAGKNHTSYGVTFEYDASTGGIKIHGTPTGKGASTTQYSSFIVSFNLEAGTYYIKNYYSGASKKTTAYVKYLKDGSTSYNYVRNKKFILNEAKAVQVYFRVEEGVIDEVNEIIYPMLVKGASPEPWAPFVGDTEEVLLEIAYEGLSLGSDSNGNKNYFIKIFEEDSTNKKAVDYFGNSLKLSDSSSSLLVGSNYIESSSILDGEVGTRQKLEFDDGFQFIKDNNIIFEIKNGYIKGSQKAIFESNIIFGKEADVGTLEYKKITNENSSGYDLYVR